MGVAERIQCHFISNTHWDREWRYSAQRTKFMLASMLDMLFDIFEKQPEFKYFHLDSQTLPIQDYLEVYPEKEERVKKYVREGRLQIGPWFCLPDEFCVGGESLIRNLLLGHKIASRYGQASKTGYSPFGWGQISQMPQIYLGFGIDVAMFYRGINTYVAPRSEFIWESPDGSRIVASRMGARPRYNVWYVIQRPVYWDQKDENNRAVSWESGHAPFHFVDAAGSGLDYQYAHPRFEYHKENLPERAAQALREQDDDWTTPHRFWSAGHDSSCPDVRETRMIADCAAALRAEADVFHSTVKALQEGIKSGRRDDWPVVRGEMRHPHTKGSVSALMGWILSARMHIKQENFNAERDLISYAEPMAVCASLLGAPYPERFIELACNWLLQNHGHDSIGACGRDVVYSDVLYRYRQSREISGCLIERAMMDIAGDIDLGGWSSRGMALAVFNPAPFARTEVMEAAIDIPEEWGCAGFAILDEKGERMIVQKCLETPSHRIVQSPNDVANTLAVTTHLVEVELKDIPPMGYRAYRIAPVEKPRATTPTTMRTSLTSMENEFLAVSVNPNGTFDLYDKENRFGYPGLCTFRDSGEIGNPWEHIPPQTDTLFTTGGEKAKICITRDGELETVFTIGLDWELPEGRSADEKQRSARMMPMKIVTTLTLKKGQRWVEILTDIDNRSEDHYMQVSFPTGIQAAHVHAQGQFDVVKRPIARPDFSKYDERPMSEHPMCSFVDINDGSRGLAILNEGLKAYEAHDDAARTISLTLLRSFPLRICVTQDMQDYSGTDKGSQCIGKHRFRFAVMPHRGDWMQGGVWQASERFTLKLRAAQIGPSRHGKGPMRKSFLELEPDFIHLSALKRSESGKGWILRLFNPMDKTADGRVRLNGGMRAPRDSRSPVEKLQSELLLPAGTSEGWGRARMVSLEETPLEELVLCSDGWVDIRIPAKKIFTMEFMP